MEQRQRKDQSPEKATERLGSMRSINASTLLLDPMVWLLLVGGSLTLLMFVIAISTGSSLASLIGTTVLGILSAVLGVVGLMSPRHRLFSRNWSIVALIIGALILIRLLISFL